MRSFLLSVLAIVAFATPASAQLVVDKMWVDLGAGQANRGDILVRNESKDRYYVTVTPRLVTAPGTEAETRMTEADPEKLGLLVTPNRMVLEPGAQRSIRLVGIGQPGETDRIYRVLISPAIGALSADVGDPASRGLAIKVLAAYEALVVVRPLKAHADLNSQRSDDQLSLTNSGNTTTLLYDLKVCAPGAAVAKSTPKDGDKGNTPSGCSDVPATRLYAGGVLRIPATAGQSVVGQQKTMADQDPSQVKY